MPADSTDRTEAQRSETRRRTDPTESHPRELSLADQERRSWRPGRWIVLVVALLLAIIVPYGAGRMLALRHTDLVLRVVGRFTPQGMALVSWAVTVALFAMLAMAVMESRRVGWRVLLLLMVACEQFIAGVGLLRFDFWNATYVVYGDGASPINASNMGIIGAAVGVAVFAVLYVGLLVLIRKDSPLNLLTRSWSALTMFFVIELIALGVIVLGGLASIV